MLAYTWHLGSVLWATLVFMFWVLAIWMFIACFADIFRRRDISGWGKAGWILLIFVVPFLGILIYVIARPKHLAQDVEDARQIETVQRRAAGYSAADDIARLNKLRQDGTLSDEEYARLKAQALGV
jgi:hypothetical protein